jgi:hypothetical protein
MRTVHQILLLGAALLWAAGHARAALPEATSAMHAAGAVVTASAVK